MYNQDNESVYLSKRPASGKGRPTYAPLSNLTKADTAKIAKLTASECDTLYELHQQQKANKKDASKNKRTNKSGAPPKGSKQTKTAPKQKNTTATIPKKKKRSSSRKRPSSKQSVKKKK